MKELIVTRGDEVASKVNFALVFQSYLIFYCEFIDCCFAAYLYSFIQL